MVATEHFCHISISDVCDLMTVLLLNFCQFFISAQNKLQFNMDYKILRILIFVT